MLSVLSRYFVRADSIHLYSCCGTSLRMGKVRMGKTLPCPGNVFPVRRSIIEMRLIGAALRCFLKQIGNGCTAPL